MVVLSVFQRKQYCKHSLDLSNARKKSYGWGLFPPRRFYFYGKYDISILDIHFLRPNLAQA